ncbi:RANGAP1 [Symbiodinium natans]|uniref:RANGAP1 protein n=1 Tax=Symbiodinium natans TaxID=878477 RepID=A0A812HXU9_9DINO|nr:RANGAP1 [Symbiodinium natans]
MHARRGRRSRSGRRARPPPGADSAEALLEVQRSARRRGLAVAGSPRRPLEALGGLPKLAALELDLTECMLGAEEAAALAGVLARLQKLTRLKLNLWQNDQLGAEGWRSLAEALGGLPKLAALGLDLRECKLGAEEAIALAGALGNLAELRELKLNLFDNQIGLQGCLALAGALRRLPALAKLYADFRRCVGDHRALSRGDRRGRPT